MHLDLKDTVTIDVLLEHLQTSAIRNDETTVAKSLGMMREYLPSEGGVPDETLVMHMQVALMPLLESNDPTGPPAAIKARIREIFSALDRNRTSQ